MDRACSLFTEGKACRLTPMPVTIDALARQDVDQFIHLLMLGFEDELEERGTNVARLAWLLRLLLTPRGIPMRTLTRLTGHVGVILVAKNAGEVVGILAVLGRHIPSLSGVYVLPQTRGQGVAMALVEEALRRLKKRGHKEARVSVSDSSGRTLAERAGFTPCDHTDLYQRRLPVDVTVPPGVRVHKARKRVLFGHPYDIGFLTRLGGIRSRHIVAEDENGAATAATLVALPHQSIGEIQPQVLRADAVETFAAVLASGCDWLTRLGRKEVSLPIHEETASLADIIVKAGFVKRKSWVQLRIELK